MKESVEIETVRDLGVKNESKRTRGRETRRPLSDKKPEIEQATNEGWRGITSDDETPQPLPHNDLIDWSKAHPGIDCSITRNNVLIFYAWGHLNGLWERSRFGITPNRKSFLPYLGTRDLATEDGSVFVSNEVFRNNRWKSKFILEVIQRVCRM
ncbi:hypothetical protein TNCV_3743411 [Trichonephila clavipes]|nr:hypothetical protein TNCV_3743411 [Trichonephila clavipes]